MANNSGLSKRAALRKQQEMEDRRKRNSRILGFSLGGVAVVVVVILAIVIAQSIGKSQQQTANQQVPPNATDSFGIQITSQGTQPAADVPHVVVYEDFQCPHCAEYEEAYGDAFNQLVDNGDITFEVRFATFMEDNLLNDSSTNAAIAASAADAVGKFREYHTHAYEQQSAGGAGFSDQQLRIDFPAAVGIEGEDLARFQELYDGKAYSEFVEDSNGFFNSEGIGSTPTYLVGDVKLQFADEATGQALILPTADDVLRAVTEAAG